MELFTLGSSDNMPDDGSLGVAIDSYNIQDKHL